MPTEGKALLAGAMGAPGLGETTGCDQRVCPTPQQEGTNSCPAARGLSWPRGGVCLVSSVWTQSSGQLSQVAVFRHAVKADCEALTLGLGPLWGLVDETVSYLLQIAPPTLPSPPPPSRLP